MGIILAAVAAAAKSAVCWLDIFRRGGERRGVAGDKRRGWVDSSSSSGVGVGTVVQGIWKQSFGQGHESLNFRRCGRGVK